MILPLINYALTCDPDLEEITLTCARCVPHLTHELGIVTDLEDAWNLVGQHELEYHVRLREGTDHE